MTDLRFNFTQAVEQLRQDYPDVTRNVTFLNLDNPDSLFILSEWSPRAYPPLGFTPAAINELATDKTSYAIQLEQGLLGLRPAKGEGSFFKNPHQDNFFSLYHEFGHLLMPGHRSDEEKDDQTLHIMCTIARESACDVFASIHGLRHGWVTVEDIMQISTKRAVKALNGDDLHTTSEALDWLVSIADQYDWQKMTPAEIKTLVTTNIPRFMPSSAEIYELKDLYKKTFHLSDDGELLYVVLEDLQKTFKAHSLPHTIVTKKLEHVLDTPHASPVIAARYADPEHAKNLCQQLADKANEPAAVKRMKQAQAAQYIWPQKRSAP